MFVRNFKNNISFSFFMDRYERQKVLKHIGEKGQEKLGKSTLAIVGLGALGTVSAELLTRAGVGKLILIDHDIIDITNLQRQVLFTEEDVNKSKAVVAAEALRKINSEVEFEERNVHLTYDNIDFLKADVILDCTDNMDTRFLINDFALKNKIPWIYSAAVEDRGMLFVSKGKPCFNCIFEKTNSLENCDNVGILNTSSVQIASMQVTEAMKILLNEETCKDLIHVNFWNHEVRKLKVKENPKCDACNGVFHYLETPKEDYKLKYCKVHDKMSAKPLRKMTLNLDLLKKQFKVLNENPLLAINVDGEDVIVRDFGELFFSKETNKERLKGLTEKIYESARA